MIGRKAQNNRSLFPIKSMDRFEICLGFKYTVPERLLLVLGCPIYFPAQNLNGLSILPLS
jgi:hypothetical protein